MLQMERFGRCAPYLVAASEERLELVYERLCGTGTTRESDPEKIEELKLTECLTKID